MKRHKKLLKDRLERAVNSCATNGHTKRDRVIDEAIGMLVGMKEGNRLMLTLSEWQIAKIKAERLANKKKSWMQAFREWCKR